MPRIYLIWWSFFINTTPKNSDIFSENIGRERKKKLKIWSILTLVLLFVFEYEWKSIKFVRTQLPFYYHQIWWMGQKKIENFYHKRSIFMCGWPRKFEKFLSIFMWEVLVKILRNFSIFSWSSTHKNRSFVVKIFDFFLTHSPNLVTIEWKLGSHKFYGFSFIFEDEK